MKDKIQEANIQRINNVANKFTPKYQTPRIHNRCQNMLKDKYLNYVGTSVIEQSRADRRAETGDIQYTTVALTRPTGV